MMRQMRSVCVCAMLDAGVGFLPAGYARIDRDPGRGKGSQSRYVTFQRRDYCHSLHSCVNINPGIPTGAPIRADTMKGAVAEGQSIGRSEHIAPFMADNQQQVRVDDDNIEEFLAAGPDLLGISGMGVDAMKTPRSDSSPANQIHPLDEKINELHLRLVKMSLCHAKASNDKDDPDEGPINNMNNNGAPNMAKEWQPRPVSHSVFTELVDSVFPERSYCLYGFYTARALAEAYPTKFKLLSGPGCSVHQEDTSRTIPMPSTADSDGNTLIIIRRMNNIERDGGYSVAPVIVDGQTNKTIDYYCDQAQDLPLRIDWDLSAFSPVLGAAASEKHCAGGGHNTEDRHCSTRSENLPQTEGCEAYATSSLPPRKARHCDVARSKGQQHMCERSQVPEWVPFESILPLDIKERIIRNALLRSRAEIHTARGILNKDARLDASQSQEAIDKAMLKGLLPSESDQSNDHAAGEGRPGAGRSIPSLLPAVIKRARLDPSLVLATKITITPRPPKRGAHILIDADTISAYSSHLLIRAKLNLSSLSSTKTVIRQPGTAPHTFHGGLSIDKGFGGNGSALAPTQELPGDGSSGGRTARLGPAPGAQAGSVADIVAPPGVATSCVLEAYLRFMCQRTAEGRRGGIMLKEVVIICGDGTTSSRCSSPEDALHPSSASSFLSPADSSDISAKRCGHSWSGGGAATAPRANPTRDLYIRIANKFKDQLNLFVVTPSDICHVSRGWQEQWLGANDTAIALVGDDNRGEGGAEPSGTANEGDEGE